MKPTKSDIKCATSVNIAILLEKYAPSVSKEIKHTQSVIIIMNLFLTPCVTSLIITELYQYCSVFVSVFNDCLCFMIWSCSA